MRLLFSFLWFCFISTAGFSQVYFYGKVADEESQEPLEYCHIINTSKQIGAISNADGNFKIHAHIGDTLLFSFVGYEDVYWEISSLSKSELILLPPSEQEFSEFVLTDQSELIIDLFKKSQRKLSHKKVNHSRGYFNLQTTKNEVPIEQMEGYYNVTMRPDSILNMNLKAGRVALNRGKGNYFFSLSTTRVMGNYNLFKQMHNRLPVNPMQLNRNFIAQKYEVTQVSLLGNTYHFFLQAKDAVMFYTAEVWIDKNKEQILKYVLHHPNVTYHPYAPLFQGQAIDSLPMQLVFEFDNQKPQRLRRYEMNYRVKYLSKGTYHWYATSAFLLLYNAEELFDLPKQPVFVNYLGDYDRIIAQPHNRFFWDRTEGFLPSNKMRQNQAYFQKNGVLINYDDYKLPNTLFTRYTQSWSMKRIQVQELNNRQRFGYSKKQIANYQFGFTVEEKQQVKLSGYIFFDRTVYPDTVTYTTQTVLDFSNSKFLMIEDQYHKPYVNIYYDLIEAERRKLQGRLESRNWSQQQSDSLYFDCRKKLKNILEEYQTWSKMGGDQFFFVKYCNYVERELGINNLNYTLKIKVVEWDDFQDTTNIKLAVRQQMNALSAYLLDGNYEQAIAGYQTILNQHRSVLTKANQGICHFNIACAYKGMANFEKACTYFTRARDLGVEVRPEDLYLCRKNRRYKTNLFFEDE